MKFTVLLKKNILSRVTKKEITLTEASREYKVARKTLYMWLKNKKDLSPKYKAGKAHPRFIGSRIRSKVISTVVKHPSYNISELAHKLKAGRHAVYNVLADLKLTTEVDRLNFGKLYRFPRVLAQDLKISAVRRLVNGAESVTSIAKDLNVARKTLYSWAKRHQIENSVSERYVEGFNHPRSLGIKFENLVLAEVVKNPSLSTHQLAASLGHSSHGVYNVLKRNSLAHKFQRYAYAVNNTAIETEPEIVGFSQEIKNNFTNFLTPNLSPAPPPISLIKLSIASFAISSVFFSLLLQVNSVGAVFSAIALMFGMIFFLYSLKYYLTLAITLSYSQKDDAPESKPKNILEKYIFRSHTRSNNGIGLNSDLESVKLTNFPFISVHIPFFNEKNVVERAIRAATGFKYKGEYEVILCDDSTDETSSLITKYQKDCLFKDEKLNVVKGDGWTLSTVDVRPGVVLKHLHRTTRDGFKGAALDLALKLMDKRAEYVSVFDADFVPYPDTLDLFLKYFQASNDIKTAAVQGYQWHVLNKSENWITRGVRSEYSGSYVIERSGAEIYGGLKQISGSVYMIKRHVLEEIGWGTSITEDFELTLKLYEKGYKVLYTPYIQAPAECASTLKRLIRQRMRWAEGHSFNIKKMFIKLMRSPNVTRNEKMEFLYLAPYYLQAFFFLVGTLCWLISETIFKTHLPFWTEVWGWSLILTNMIALPMVNAVGLFMEESEHKDYSGIGSFIALSYIVVPFQAYAAVKGFMEKEEGPWFRTPKTGRITDIFARTGFMRFIQGIIPGKEPQLNSSYLALNTANSKFNNFKITPKNIRWVGKLSLVILLSTSILLMNMAFRVPLAKASAGTQIKTVEFYLYQFATTTANDDIADGNGITDTAWTASTCGDSNDVSKVINLPESGSITVRSAYVEYRTVVETPATTGGDIEFCRSGQSLVTQTFGSVMTDSAESMPIVVRLDVTSAVIGGSNTYYFNVNLDGTVRNSDNAKIVITYEYDQTSTTQLKTVRQMVGCRYTQAAAGTTDSFTVNPNLTDGSISVADHWVEYISENNSGADHQLLTAMNSTNGSSVQTDDVNATGYGITVLNQFLTSNINLTSNNSIDLINNGGTSDSKCAEWVITYSYSYFTNPATQVKTVRYFAGQLSGDLPATATTIGSPSVCVPESSPSYRKVWIRYMASASAADTITMRATISPGAEQTQTADFAANVSAGGETVALFDITSYFNTNFTPSCETVTIAASASGAGVSGIRAEIIITYGYNAVSSTIGNKTVWWFAGQDYASNAPTANFTSSFTTFIPDPGTEIWRSAAVLFDCNHGFSAVASCTVTADNPSIGATDSSAVTYVLDNESSLNNPGVLASTQITNVAQTIDMTYASNQRHTSGGVAYHTYETTNNEAPEFGWIFVPIAILAPMFIKRFLIRKKNYAWRRY